MLKLEDLPNELNALIDSYNDKRVEQFYTFHWINKRPCSYPPPIPPHTYPRYSKHCIHGPCWYTVVYADHPRCGGWRVGCIEPGLVFRYVYWY